MNIPTNEQAVALYEEAVSLARTQRRFPHLDQCNASYDPRGACNCGAAAANRVLNKLAASSTSYKKVDSPRCANCGDSAAYHGDTSNTCKQWVEKT